MGQMAMATDRGGWQTMVTSGARSPISKRPFGTEVEAATGAWTVRALWGVPQGVSEVDQGKKGSDENRWWGKG